jgi:hypothetical protein
MAEPHAPVPEHHDNPEVEHEYSDINVRAVILFGVGMLIAAVVIHVALWWLHEYFQGREGDGRPPSPVAELRPRLPHDVAAIPEPRLQLDEAADLERRRQRELAHLDTYGWIDEKNGVVHIPITRAMELLTRPGALPARAQEK